MELTLKRNPNPEYTIGRLYINGQYECFVLEDPVREEKIKGKTAIPAGRYQIIVTMSARFSKLLPLLLNVPNFSGIRIHPGNDVDDTEGCLLTGQMIAKSARQILNSRLAFNALFEKINMALARKEEVWITIIN